MRRYRDARAASQGKKIRWRLLVDWKQQLRGTALSLAVVTLMLVVMNVAAEMSRGLTEAGVSHASADVKSAVAQAHGKEALVTVLLSAAFLVLFALARLVETHRIEGASVSLLRRLEEIEHGHLQGIARLRRGDRLGSVADAIDSMALGLKEQARDEVRELEDLATRTRRVDSKYAAKDVADQIMRIASAKRQTYEASRDPR